MLSLVIPQVIELSLEPWMDLEEGRRAADAFTTAPGMYVSRGSTEA